MEMYQESDILNQWEMMLFLKKCFWYNYVVTLRKTYTPRLTQE